MKLLIIRPGALGDTLMLLPSFLALSKKAEVTFVGRQPGLGYIQAYVKGAMDMERHGWHRLFMENRDGICLPISGVDKTVVFLNDEDGVVRRNLQSVLPMGSVFVFPSLPPREEPIHVARYVAECLETAGLPIDPDVVLKEAKQGTRIRTGQSETSRNNIVFHSGSGSGEKNYSGDFWVGLMGLVGNDSRLSGFESVILLGPAEKNLVPFFQSTSFPSEIRILFCPDKRRLLELLGETAVYIGHDSGVTHLSAMMGTPTIALFRNSDPIQWGPLGRYVDIITHPNENPEVMDQVFKAAKKFLYEH